LEKIAGAIGAKGNPWTAKSVLPGGDFPATGYEAEVAKLKGRYPFLNERHARRLVRLYGTLAVSLLGSAGKAEDLGRHFGADLYEVEVRWLMTQEWARHAEDILWRRTKLGLTLTQAEAAGLEDYMRETIRNVA
jgi:glycerol-3-phosphate dehydrogenase